MNTHPIYGAVGVTPREWVENCIAVRAIAGVPLAEIDRFYGITAAELGISIPSIYQEYTA